MYASVNNKMTALLSIYCYSFVLQKVAIKIMLDTVSNHVIGFCEIFRF